MEAVGLGEDSADYGVRALFAAVGDSVEPGVDDFVELGPEGLASLTNFGSWDRWTRLIHLWRSHSQSSKLRS